MENKPALEAKLLYSLPSEPIKRLRRLLLYSFAGATIFFLFSGGALFGLNGGGLFQWRSGVAILLISFLNLITFPFWMTRIQTPVAFYVVKAYIRLPIFALMLVAGISFIDILLSPGSTRWIGLGLISGLLFFPFAFKRKTRWVEDSLENGYLKRCLNEKSWTWDAAHDMDHIRRDPKKMRPGFIWRLLFWIGPAIGMSLADIFGELNGLLIASLIGIMTGYLTMISILIDTIPISLVILNLEEERGEKIQLEREE